MEEKEKEGKKQEEEDGRKGETNLKRERGKEGNRYLHLLKRINSCHDNSARSRRRLTGFPCIIYLPVEGPEGVSIYNKGHKTV